MSSEIYTTLSTYFAVFLGLDTACCGKWVPELRGTTVPAL
jgi:hypothetical protein